MKVLLAVMLVSPWPVMAQFDGLATNDDGSMVYFTTPLRQKGTAQSLYQKLFAIDAKGLRLVVARDPGGPIGNTTTNFYQISNPEVSDDGSALAYTASRPCYGGSSCIPVEVNEAVVGTLQAAGRITTSRNGRYALVYGSNPFLGGPRGSTLFDLQTGAKTAIADAFGWILHRVLASDGTLLEAPGDTTFLLRSATSTRTVTVSERAYQSFTFAPFNLNDAGTRIVYLTVSERLVAYDVPTAHETVLATGVAPNPFTISSDGRHVVYLRTVGKTLQAFFDDRQLTAVLEGVTEATLSGDASTAYATTGEGRVLKITIAAGTIDELVPRTPQVLTYSNETAPGSAVLLTGSALQSTSITINSAPATLLSVSPDQLWFFVPFDAPVGSTKIHVDPGASPFETGPDSITLLSFAPQFIGVPNLVAAHQDFLSLITTDSPARGGEAIHLWMTGLGPVDGGSPPRIVAPFRCRFWDGKPNDAQVLYAGLAPGLTGFYQIDVVVPAGLAFGFPTVECGSADPDSFGATGSLSVIPGS